MIKTPYDLRKAITLVISGENTDITEIAKYKWYNFYQNIHIKRDSIEDKENIQIFTDLCKNHPEINGEIENYIDILIDKQDNDVDY